jgi:hypothetical protein
MGRRGTCWEKEFGNLKSFEEGLRAFGREMKEFLETRNVTLAPQKQKKL